MTRHKPYSPEPRRRTHEYTPAQLARQSAIGAELRALAVKRYPERFSASGESLIGWPGTTWSERLAAYVASREGSA
jgi:hypothetical protein